jgi:tRNA/rRNA methyltransferase
MPEEIRDIIGDRKDVAIVLGRDTTGLTVSEIQACDLVVHIPTWTAYPTLNISHALAIILYTVARSYKQRGAIQTRAYPSPEEINKLEGLVREAAHKLGYDEARRERTVLAIRRLVSGPQAGAQEVRALMGLIRRLTLGLNMAS